MGVGTELGRNEVFPSERKRVDLGRQLCLGCDVFTEGERDLATARWSQMNQPGH